MLSDRRQQILCALIEEYVSRAMPVGSRTLTDNYALGVSSATIRNELSILEEAGYISQPHTSAGRIPTDSGYRAFVDHLLMQQMPDERPEYLRAAEQAREEARELDDLLERTSAALARMTDCLSIVLAPSVVNLRLKQISLISFSEYSVIIVVVTEDGQVLNRHVALDMPLSSDELAVLQNQLNASLLGKTITEVEAGIGTSIRFAQGHPAAGKILSEVLDCLQEGNGTHAHRLGLSALLAKPEFADSHNIIPVIQILEDESVLLEIVDDVLHSDEDPLIRIGRENVSEGLSGVSVIASQYGRGNSAGVIAVIGPTRMDYSRAIAAVRAARRNLQDT